MTREINNMYKVRVLKAAIRFTSQPCKHHVSLQKCADYYSVSEEHVQDILTTLENWIIMV